jgi:hypothetical protein
MPSPKRTRKTPSPKRNATRRSPRNTFNDDFFEAMKRGDLKWGDLLMDVPVAPRSKSPSPRPVALEYTMENDALEDYVVPDLTMRRGIWENFPVILDEVEPVGGMKSYAVKWHRKNLKEWKSSRAASWDEYMEYEAFAEFRLLHSLRAYSHLYRIAKPKDDSEIVRLVALREPNVPASPPRAAAYRGPELGPKLADINKVFPGTAVWNKVEGRRGESTWAITIRGDFKRRHRPAELERALDEFEAALRSSRYWTVLRPAAGSDELVRLEMRHD